MKLPGRIFFLALLALAVGGAFYASQRRSSAAEGDGSAAAPQAMPVTAAVVESEDIQIWKDFSGRLHAVDQVELRPQVGGRITEVRFSDGQDVEKGAVLFVIDPKPYEAALTQAKAELNAAQNEAALATKEYERAQELIKTEAIAKRLLDERSSARSIAWANVNRAKAMVETAQIDLDHAYVKAPIAGKTGRVEITQGNIVEPGAGAPLLTTIVSREGIYADFDIDEQTYLRHVRSQDNSAYEESRIPVKLTLNSDTRAYEGFIYSFDNALNTSSGTIRARALFGNEDGHLLPGMSVRVSVGGGGADRKILVSEKAIGTDQDRKFVYIVSPENKTAYREVEIGDSIDGKRIVLSGLMPGDTVITEGIMRLRPDMPVQPRIAESAPAPAAAMPAAGDAPESESESEPESEPQPETAE